MWVFTANFTRDHFHSSNQFEAVSSVISTFYYLLLLYFSICLDFAFMRLNRVIHFYKMAWITCCMNTHKDMLPKDINFGIFSNTSGRITETYQIDWLGVYSIFDSDDLSDIQNDQLAYWKIRDYGLHPIASRPSILPYTDAVRWIVYHANLKDRSFNDSAGS